ARATREKRLLNAAGRPNFGIRFYAVNKAGQYGGATMYSHNSTGKRRQFAVADSSGARMEDAAFLFEGRMLRSESPASSKPITFPLGWWPRDRDRGAKCRSTDAGT